MFSAPLVDEIKEEWDLDENFKEVPLPFLRRSAWEVRLAGPWAYRAAVHIGEARAGVMSVGLLAKDVSNHGRRHLVIGDNLGVTLAFERKRASAFPLLVQIRRLASLSLATNMFIAWRWVPSEYNAADQPSRNRDIRPGDMVSLSPLSCQRTNALQSEIQHLGSLLGAKDEEISSPVARPFLDSSPRYVKSAPSKQQPCKRACGLASVSADSGAEGAEHYEGHEDKRDGGERLKRRRGMQREFEGGVERHQAQEARKNYEAVRKVLGPGGEWKRVKTFFAGDKDGNANLRGSVPHILRGIPGLLRGEGLRRKARPRQGIRVGRFLLGYVLRGRGTEQKHKDPGSSYGKPAGDQCGGRPDTSKSNFQCWDRLCPKKAAENEADIFRFFPFAATKDDQLTRTHPLGHKGLVGLLPPGLGGDVVREATGDPLSVA